MTPPALTEKGSKDAHPSNNLSLEVSHNDEGNSLEIDLDKLKQQLGLPQIVQSMETITNLLQDVVAIRKAELPSFQHTKNTIRQPHLMTRTELAQCLRPYRRD